MADQPTRYLARLQVLRADPATYETLPPDPGAESGLLTYSDWRAGYFDEETCRPRPGVPMPLRPVGMHTNTQLCGVGMEPIHPDPAQLLAECPVIRRHLLRLVNPDLTEVDSSKI
ncbi:unnamed protein product [Protopolystoma xenopodis]|uniref:Uncharacterized protein n=1 Tax=Protopolystoma xenopodis TaxID=117903 RepID=A0A448XL71_9PLAT|nr:unnamed protein product [Protopolystoma xenopodis]